MSAETVPPVPSPLSSFEKIGHNTYLHTTPKYTSSPSSPLILLCTWMDAQPKHIAKYTISYDRLLPAARILLVRNATRDFFRSTPEYTRLLKPAFDVLDAHIKSGGEVLVHSFSNGGARQLIELAALWSSRHAGTPLPMRTLALDSSPGKGEYSRSHAAMTIGLPKSFLAATIGSVLVHCFLIAIFLFDIVTGRENVILTLRRRLNDMRLFDKRAPRVYLYSKADVMVGADEAASHADAAAASGWDVVKVLFENSPHAGHIREDEGRYWGAIMGAWERGRSREE